jgi:hypothetical protein
VKTEGVNQDGTTVIEFRRTFMIWKARARPASAKAAAGKPGPGKATADKRV